MRHAGVVAMLLAGVATAGCRSSSGVTVERFESELVLSPEGHVLAGERLQARTAGTSFTFSKPLPQADSVTGATAALDGTPLDGGQVRIETNGGIEVEWPVGENPAALHTFDVSYRAMNVVAVRGANATFWWRLLPPDREFAVAHAIAHLRLPAGTILTRDPWTLEPGWTITRGEDVVTVEKRGVSAAESGTLLVPFIVDPRAITEPRWQFNLERGRDLIPAFISGGLFILVIGGGVLIMIRLQYPARGRAAPDPARVVAARGLRVAGAVTIGVGVACVPITQWTLGHYGAWSQAIAGSLIVVGLGWVAFGARKQI